MKTKDMQEKLPFPEEVLITEVLTWVLDLIETGDNGYEFLKLVLKENAHERWGITL